MWFLKIENMALNVVRKSNFGLCIFLLNAFLICQILSQQIISTKSDDDDDKVTNSSESSSYSNASVTESVVVWANTTAILEDTSKLDTYLENITAFFEERKSLIRDSRS